MSSQLIDSHSGTSDQPDVFLSPPPPAENSVRDSIKTTPSQRKTEAKMPKSAKKRVQDATKNLGGGNCAIENVEDNIAVQYAHCLARATGDETLDCLEYSWGMGYRTLNLDTRSNILKLSATLHILFDSGAWMPLPEADIINQYYDAAQADDEVVSPEIRRAAFPSINYQQYTYKIIAQRSMRHVPIHRQKSSTHRPDGQVSACDFTFLDYPYDGHKVISHVHPRYIICNAGQKLEKETSGNYIIIRDTYPQEATLIDKVLKIYTAWTKGVGKTEALFDFKSSGNSGGADDTQSQNSSRQTKKRRVNERKRPRAPQEQGSPMSQRGQDKKQKGGNHDAAWLDEGTLCELQSEHAGRNPGKGKEIMEWASCVAELSGREHVMESPTWVIM